MAMNFFPNSGGQFRFPTMAPAMRAFYEDEGGARYAWDYLKEQASGSQDSMFGGWFRSQFQPEYSRYINDSLQSGGNTTWTGWLEQRAPAIAQQYFAQAPMQRGANPRAFRLQRQLW